MTKRMYAKYEEAVALGFFSLKDLKAQRLKPSSGTKTMEYRIGRHIRIAYSAAGCVPMRAYRPASEAQRAALAAGRELVGFKVCKRCKKRNVYPDSGRGFCDDCQLESRRNHLTKLFGDGGHVVYLDTECRREQSFAGRATKNRASRKD